MSLDTVGRAGGHGMPLPLPSDQHRSRSHHGLRGASWLFLRPLQGFSEIIAGHPRLKPGAIVPRPLWGESRVLTVSACGESWESWGQATTSPPDFSGSSYRSRWRRLVADCRGGCGRLDRRRSSPMAIDDPRRRCSRRLASKGVHDASIMPHRSALTAKF